MSLFKKLRGTVEYVLHIGGPLKSLWKTDGVGSNTWFKARNYDDSEYVHVMGLNHSQGGVDDDNLGTQLDIKAYFPLIYAGFDGGSPPSWTDDKFYMCHTSGGSYTAGRVYYKKSTGASPILIDTTYIGHIVTNDAISGTVSFEEDWLYTWDGSAWEKKCDLSAGDSGKQYIGITIGTTSPYTSTAVVPTGAIITDVIVDITTAYTGATSFTVECDSNNIVSGTDVWYGTINQYVVEDVTPIGSGDTVEVTIGGTLSAGAGKVYVGYVTPKA